MCACVRTSLCYLIKYYNAVLYSLFTVHLNKYTCVRLFKFHYFEIDNETENLCFKDVWRNYKFYLKLIYKTHKKTLPYLNDFSASVSKLVDGFVPGCSDVFVCSVNVMFLFSRGQRGVNIHKNERLNKHDMVCGTLFLTANLFL